MTITSQANQYLSHQHFQKLLDTLMQSGYRCIGPQVHEHTIHYAELEDVRFLPLAMSDEQQPGSYRLSRGKHKRYFAWANGAQGLKPLLFQPREALWQVQKNAAGGTEYQELVSAPHPVAVIGVRPCDIAALYIQDRHFLQQNFRDPYYLSHRQDMLLIAVNCTHPAKTCFCASTGDGPSADFGYDILLTELDKGFVVHAHTDKGCKIIEQLPLKSVTAKQINEANQAMKRAAESQQRQLPAVNIQKSLADNPQHPHWQEIASRCLACGNCTAVCPTCFCHSETDEPALDGSHSVHFRQWDSCFSQKHSYIHGITIRSDTSLRYRQWLTHKLSSWYEQYGRSGCVGCGRCITWCPVGIDLTEEVKAFGTGEADD